MTRSTKFKRCRIQCSLFVYTTNKETSRFIKRTWISTSQHKENTQAVGKDDELREKAITMKEKPPVPTFFEEKPPPRGGGGGQQQNREVRESGPEEEEMMPPLPVYVAPEWSGPPEGQT